MRITLIMILAVALGGSASASFGILDFVKQGVGIAKQVVNIANSVKKVSTGSNKDKELQHHINETVNGLKELHKDGKTLVGMFKKNRVESTNKSQKSTNKSQQTTNKQQKSRGDGLQQLGKTILTSVNRTKELGTHVTSIFKQLKDSVSKGPAQFETILQQINSIQGLDPSIIGILKNMESTGQRVSWELTVETFETLLRRINSNYDQFVLIQKKISAIKPPTLENFARAAVSHNTGWRSTMYSLRDLVIGSEQSDPHGRHRRNAFKLGIFREMKLVVEGSRNTVCGLNKSPQQLAYGLYGTLVRALVKDYTMTQFAFMQLRLSSVSSVFENGAFMAESRHFTDNYLNISLAMALEASSVMRELKPTFWRCDPARHERGATYEEVTKLLQGRINVAKQLHSCKGTEHDCRALPTKTPLKTECLSNSQEGAHRRYNWLQFSDGIVLGRKRDSSLGSCAGTKNRATHKTTSGTRGLSNCSSCSCLCDDDTSSDRYFSLLPTVSDITENKIVTGVRFVKIGRVFYIQLEQGVADRSGYVKSSTVQWKPIDRPININRDVEGRDYIRLSYKKRSVILQDLRGSRGKVVTGVSFKTVGSDLSLRIQVTAISRSATLVPSLSHWLSGSTSKPSPPSLDLGSDPEVPTVSTTPNWPDSQPGQTLRFEASSMKQDVAQTTLPLLDIQPVAPRPAVWLTGIGLYHKGQKGGGGFLGLSVQMADMTLARNTTPIALLTEALGSSSCTPFRPPGSLFIVFALSTLIKMTF